MSDLIPFTEIEVPEDWSYDESVKKMRPMVRRWIDMSNEFFIELKIAKKAIDGEWTEENGDILKNRRGAAPTWTSYCDDVGISPRHAGRLIAENFYDPFLYNIWNWPKKDVVDQYGHFPSRFMRNLLHYHTKPGDLIYDPFAGSGVTIDVCEEMGRSYYCSDLMPSRGTIREWDIADGVPDELDKIDLAFLDPPYRSQAENKYSDEDNDIANMSLPDFLSTLKVFLSLLEKRKVKKIAIVVAPGYKTQQHDWEDFIFYFHEMLCENYKIISRCVLPLSTEQYRGSQVNDAKNRKVMMNLIRDLVVWESK